MSKDTVATLLGAIAAYAGVKYLHSVTGPRGASAFAETVSELPEKIESAQCSALARKKENLLQQLQDHQASYSTDMTNDEKWAWRNEKLRLQKALITAAAQQRELGCL